MTKGSDNPFPSVLFVEGAAPSSPAATNFRLFYDSSDHLLKWKNSAGTVTVIATGTPLTNPMTTTGDMIYSSSGSTPARRGIGSTGNVLTVAGGVPTWAAPGGGVTATTNYISGDVAVTSANTFYDGPSLSLNGTYFLCGTVTLVNGGSADSFTAKLWNGTATASTSEITTAGAGYDGSIALSGYVVTSGSETWKISVADNNGSGTIKAATPHNAAGNTASFLIALKLA